MLLTETIVQMPTTSPDVYAFRIRGKVTAEDMHAMAATMNEVFDSGRTISMLLLFEAFDGAEAGAMFDPENVKSRFRSLAHVEKYAVVGAPTIASAMIAVMDKLIPVDARSFAGEEEAEAWSFVGARPLT